MKVVLTEQQIAHADAVTRWAARHLAPHADAWDEAGALPPELPAQLGAAGWFAATIGESHGGARWEAIDVGLMHEAIGRVCSSTRSMLTVQAMVARVIERFASAPMRARWLEGLASGEVLAGFALSEAQAGSAPQDLETRAEPDGDGFRLYGCKRWITVGLRADVFLVFARAPGGVAAFLVEGDAAQLRREPVTGLFGLRAGMLADLHLNGCRVPREAMIGRPGAGLPLVAGAALDLGRYTVAWGCVGIARAALDAAREHTRGRLLDGAPLAHAPLARRLLCDMDVASKSARLMCWYAGRCREAGSLEAPAATTAAKYHAAQVARRCARDALQLHGAAGLTGGAPVQRLLRDASVMTVIEGANEPLQQVLGGLV